MNIKALSLLAVFAMNCLSADAHLDSDLLEPQTEFEQLTVILTKYGNNPEGIPALNYAILQQDEPAIDLLLKYEASLYTRSSQSTAFNCLTYAIQSGSIELVKKIIALGINPSNVCFAEGGNALFAAIYYNQNEIAKYLIENGVNLEPTDCGVDYLHECLWRKNYEIYEILLKHGLKAK